MSEHEFQYSAKPRGILRTLLAVWRVLRDKEEVDANVEEAMIAQIGFIRSRWGKKITRWDLVAEDAAAKSPVAAKAIAERQRMPPYDLDALVAMPVGSLGHTFATICRQRDIDPNLIDIPHDSDGEWLMAHMYETHDLWHLLIGYYYDMEGELGNAGFVMGQLPKFSFIVLGGAILLLRTAWNDRKAVAPLIKAFVDGYKAGEQAECLIGIDWTTWFERDLDELRTELKINDAGKIPALPLAA